MQLDTSQVINMSNDRHDITVVKEYSQVFQRTSIACESSEIVNIIKVLPRIPLQVTYFSRHQDPLPNQIKYTFVFLIMIKYPPKIIVFCHAILDKWKGCLDTDMILRNQPYPFHVGQSHFKKCPWDSFIYSNLFLFPYFMKTVQFFSFKKITNKQSYLMRLRKFNKYSLEASSGSRGLCSDAWEQTINVDKNKQTDN